MNLTWIEQGRLAAMGQPWPEDVPRLREIGVTHVIALTERLAAELDADDVIAALHLPVRDFTPPSQDQLLRAVLFIEQAHAKGGIVAVHCGAGLGRTGTVCAAWFVSRGQDPREAITNVRRRRPGSVETRGQEGAIAAFAVTWRGRSTREGNA